MANPYGVISDAMSNANNPPPPKPATSAQLTGQTGVTADRSKDPGFQAKLAKSQADAAAYEAAQAKKKIKNALVKP